MATTSRRLVVADAGPIIHLDELDCLDLLADLGTILIPIEVWHEVRRHRVRLAIEHFEHLSLSSETPPPSVRLRSLSQSMALGTGEVAAITLMEHSSATMLLCDDAAARLAAESLGFTVHGSIGILIRSIRRGTRDRSAVLTLLRELAKRSSLHISRDLLDQVIAQVERSVPESR